MAKQRITPFNFERPSSTFVPLPTGALTKAGSILQDRFIQNQSNLDLVDDIISSMPRVPGDDEAINLAGETARQRIAEINKSGDFENQSRGIRRLASDVARNPGFRQIRMNAKELADFDSITRQMVASGRLDSALVDRKRQSMLQEFQKKGGSFSPEGNLNMLETSLPVQADPNAFAEEVAKTVPVQAFATETLTTQRNPITGESIIVIEGDAQMAVYKNALEKAIRNAINANPNMQNFIKQEAGFQGTEFNSLGTSTEIINSMVQRAMDFARSSGKLTIDIPTGQLGRGRTSPSTSTFSPGGFRSQVQQNNPNIKELPRETAGSLTVNLLTEEEEAEFDALNERIFTGNAGDGSTRRKDISTKDAARHQDLQALRNSKYTSLVDLVTIQPELAESRYQGITEITAELSAEDPTITKGELNIRLRKRYDSKRQHLQSLTDTFYQMTGKEQEFFNDVFLGAAPRALGSILSATFEEINQEGGSTPLPAKPTLRKIAKSMGLNIDNTDDIKKLKESININGRLLPINSPGELIMSIGNRQFRVQGNNIKQNALTAPLTQLGRILAGNEAEVTNINFTSIVPIKGFENITLQGKDLGYSNDQYRGREGIFILKEDVILPPEVQDALGLSNNTLQAGIEYPTDFLVNMYKLQTGTGN